jgi:uncharacterized protein involved in outer membrane biogenesis
MSRFRLFSRLALVAVLCAAVAAATFGIPAGSIVSWSIGRIDPAIARSVKIGHAQVRLFPLPALVAEDVALADPAHPDLEIARVKRAVLEPALLTLFSTKPRLHTATLSGATLILDPLREHRARPAASPNVEVGKFVVEDGSVVARGASGSDRLLLGGINGEFTSKANEARSLSGTARIGRYTIAIKGRPEAPAGALLPLRLSGEVGRDGGADLMHASLLLARDASANFLTCRVLAGTLQGEPFDAYATIDASRKKPVIAASADFEKLRFDSFGSERRQSPFDTLEDMLNLTFKVSAKQVKGPGLEFAPAHAEVRLAGGRLTLDASDTGAFGGVLSARATVERQGDARTSFQLSDASMTRLILALDWPRVITGSLGAEGAFELPPRQEASIGDLSGHLAFKIENGAVKAPHFLGILQTLSATKNSQKILNDDGEMPFSFASGKVRIDSGVAASEDIVFESSALRMTGRAEANLSKQVLHATLEPEIQSDEGGVRQWKKLDVPVQITGPFQAPEIAVEVAGIDFNSKQLKDLASEGAKLLGLKPDGAADPFRDAIKDWGDLIFGGERTSRNKPPQSRP